jgi:hypothetical protein
MHGPINFKSPKNTSKWQMGFNSAFKGLISTEGNATDLFPHIYPFETLMAQVIDSIEYMLNKQGRPKQCRRKLGVLYCHSRYLLVHKFYFTTALNFSKRVAVCSPQYMQLQMSHTVCIRRFIFAAELCASSKY